MKSIKYKMGDNAERCCITGRCWLNEEVAITYEGPIATILWGDASIEFDNEGRAIMPPHIVELFTRVNGREPDND